MMIMQPPSKTVTMLFLLFNCLDYEDIDNCLGKEPEKKKVSNDYGITKPKENIWEKPAE